MADLGTILRANGIDATTLQRLEAVGPDAVHRLVVHGRDAIPMWRRLRAIVNQTAHWPVILGDGNAVRSLQERVSRFAADDPRQIIASGERMSAAEWFAAERDYKAKYLAAIANPDTHDVLKDMYRQMLELLERTPGIAQPPPMPETWPDDAPPNVDFMTPYNSEGLIDRLSVGLVPTQAAWRVPAMLGFGHFNACPHPSVHVCLLKHWNQTHGAELVAMTNDTVELAIARPPLTREDAIALNRDHSIYCSDANEQLGLAPHQMPARLLGGTVWYFWWD
jgi:hypothetical protein